MLLKDFEETKKLLDNSTLFYIITTDMTGVYTYLNTNYIQTFEHVHGSILGQPFEITMHPDDVKTCEEVSVRCFENPGNVYPATIRKHDGKGGYIITQWEYKAIFNENNEPEGVFCLGYDITNYMVQQEQLKATQSLLNLKNNQLEEIAWQQSHILRRPLSNIMGLAMILEKMEVDQNLKNICAMLLESSYELDEVIRKTVDKTL
ncbi:PAS domain-containing protein [Pontibacter sp. SGAir0037]|uniref:PAS domain-containing protein n=1 Tax=Pontibacter sp. SGAir0037 TaxID=2571030 RepID=UPI0010CD6BCA|nr:PAS domain-containing protein [Pontibacter sp. SGAir0037]QCR22092.1 hypothetical protein C1N53_06885 [Pontibacter sp. SGAir0037]